MMCRASINHARLFKVSAALSTLLALPQIWPGQEIPTRFRKYKGQGTEVGVRGQRSEVATRQRSDKQVSLWVPR